MRKRHQTVRDRRLHLIPDRPPRRSLDWESEPPAAERRYKPLKCMMGDAIHQNKRHTKPTTLGCLFFFFNLPNRFILFIFGCSGFPCCTRAFSSCGELGLLFMLCLAFPLQGLFLLWSVGSRHRGFSSCGAQAYLLCGMWDLLGPGIQAASPALAGGFLTTGPPGTYKTSYVHRNYAILKWL